MKVGTHVTFDWDGPSQGVINSIEGDTAVVKVIPRYAGDDGLYQLPLSELTEGKLEWLDDKRGYITVPNNPLNDDYGSDYYPQLGNSEGI